MRSAFLRQLLILLSSQKIETRRTEITKSKNWTDIVLAFRDQEVRGEHYLSHTNERVMSVISVTLGVTRVIVRCHNCCRIPISNNVEPQIDLCVANQATAAACQFQKPINVVPTQ